RRLQREQGPSSHVFMTERKGPMTAKAFHALFGRIGARAKNAQAAAGGQQIVAIEVASGRDIDAAFTRMARERVDALFVAPGTFFNTRRVQLAILAARHALPAIYSVRAYPEVGGLISYGTDVLDAFRQVGVYTARILKGARPADLPVVQSTKFELVINLN